jgi:hypothetical protein
LLNSLGILQFFAIALHPFFELRYISVFIGLDAEVSPQFLKVLDTEHKIKDNVLLEVDNFVEVFFADQNGNDLSDDRVAQIEQSLKFDKFIALDYRIIVLRG